MYKNPINEEVFTDKSSFIESLAKEWEQLVIDRNQLQQDEAALILSFLEISEMGLDNSGKEKLKGLERTVKIDRGTNVSYQKERDEEHPLSVICKRFPFINEFVAFDPRERGQGLEKFLKQAEFDTREDHQIARNEIMSRRIVKAAKPTIKIEFKNE